MKLLRTVVNGWLAAVALEGVIRLVGGLLELATGLDLVRMLIFPVEAAITVGSLVVWLAVLLTPRLPIRVVLPPLLVVAWMVVGAMPVSLLFLAGPGMNLALGTALLGSVAAAELSARTAGHGRWLLNAEPLGEGFAPTWRRALTWGGSWAVLAPVALVVYAVGSVSWALSWGTAGFLTMTPSGVSAAHRTYTLGDDTVDLVAMIHVGDEAAYDELFREFPPGTLVLAEGVSDRENRLTAKGNVYGAAAASLGLSEQRPIDEIAPLEVRRADVDVSDFDPVVLELLDTVFALYANLDDPAPWVANYLAFWQRHRQDSEQVLEQVWTDLVVDRNAHLLAELEAARADRDRMVLPWGALHLPGIERELLDDGWTLQSTRRVTLIAW